MLCRHGTLASGLESRALRPRRCIASFRRRSSFSFSFSLSLPLPLSPPPLFPYSILSFSLFFSALLIFLLFPPVAACQYAARSCIPPMVECSIRRNGSGVLAVARVDVKRRGGRRVGLKDRIGEARQAIAISPEALVRDSDFVVARRNNAETRE